MWERIRIMTSSIWEFILPFVRSMLSKAGPILAQATLLAVQTIADNAKGETSNEKRDLAFAAIVKDLESKGLKLGIDTSVSLINAAIEVAYQKIQK